MQITGCLLFIFLACQTLCFSQTKTRTQYQTIQSGVWPKTVLVESGLEPMTATTSGELKGKKSAFVIADQMEADALSALSFVKDLKFEANTEFGVTINNIKTMSYLSIYYAYKVRGAIYSKQANKTSEARDELGKAYCWWINYANLMDANFTGMELARSATCPTGMCTIIQC